MYISSIQIKGLRNYVNNTIKFNEGVNVIIGHNNAGKSNLLKALSLILDNKNSKRLEVDDFNKNIDIPALQSAPPEVTISISIVQSEQENLMSVVGK